MKIKLKKKKTFIFLILIDLIDNNLLKIKTAIWYSTMYAYVYVIYMVIYPYYKWNDDNNGIRNERKLGLVSKDVHITWEVVQS